MTQAKRITKKAAEEISLLFNSYLCAVIMQETAKAKGDSEMRRRWVAEQDKAAAALYETHGVWIAGETKPE